MVKYIEPPGWRELKEENASLQKKLKEQDGIIDALKLHNEQKCWSGFTPTVEKLQKRVQELEEKFKKIVYIQKEIVGANNILTKILSGEGELNGNNM